MFFSDCRYVKKKKKKPHGKNIMSASAMQGGHNEQAANSANAEQILS